MFEDKKIVGLETFQGKSEAGTWQNMFLESGIKCFSGRNIFFTGKIADSKISHLQKKVTDYCNLISRQRNFPEKQIIVPAVEVKKLLGRSIFLLSLGEASQT